MGRESDAAYYRNMAARLVEIAAAMSDPESKARTLATAAEFEKLAEYVEAKNPVYLIR